VRLWWTWRCGIDESRAGVKADVKRKNVKRKNKKESRSSRMTNGAIFDVISVTTMIPVPIAPAHR
jgi:hypothetical protein